MGYIVMNNLDFMRSLATTVGLAKCHRLGRGDPARMSITLSKVVAYRTHLLVTRLAVSTLLGSGATSGLVDDVAGVDGILVILLYVAVRM